MNRPMLLLVDDEAYILSALKRIFRSDDYEVITTTNPHEALATIKTKPIDILITDQRMPSMTGVELLLQARNLKPDTIRMMLTGFADLKSAEDAINKGEVWRFFMKPWNDEDLRSTVRQAVQQIELQRENRRLMALTRQQNIALRKRELALSERVESQNKAIEETQEKMAQTEKLASLGMLAGGIAHEINNPLGGILNMTQLILDDVEQGTQIHSDLKEIETAALHTKTIVENLLQFARQSRQPEMGVAKLSDILDRVLNLIGHSLKIKDIDVIFDAAPDLPDICCDANKIQQVFMNLISNAAQAMTGSGLIRIEATESPDKTEVRIKVIDNGIGIPADVLPRIFDPFFTTKPAGEGTGLGLSITYGIIKIHGGTIDVESNPGVGTTFTIKLPAHKAGDCFDAESVPGKEIK